MRATLSLLLCLQAALLCSAEPPVPTYLPTAYSTTNPHAFSPPSAFSFTAPSAFASPSPTYSAPSKTYSSPRRTYLPAASAKYSAPSVPVSTYGAPSAKSYEEYSEPANYEFHYNVYDGHYGTDFGHKEARKGDVAQGQYMVLLPDGRRQIVEYIADSNGYRPTIRYEGEAKTSGYSYPSQAKSSGYR